MEIIVFFIFYFIFLDISFRLIISLSLISVHYFKKIDVYLRDLIENFRKTAIMEETDLGKSLIFTCTRVRSDDRNIRWHVRSILANGSRNFHFARVMFGAALFLLLFSHVLTSVTECK